MQGVKYPVFLMIHAVLWQEFRRTCRARVIAAVGHLLPQTIAAGRNSPAYRCSNGEKQTAHTWVDKHSRGAEPKFSITKKWKMEKNGKK